MACPERAYTLLMLSADDCGVRARSAGTADNTALIGPPSGSSAQRNGERHMTGTSPAQSGQRERTVRLQPHAVSRRTNAGLTMLFDRAKGVMYELNESASAVVELLGSEPQQVADVIDILADRFEADPDEIEQDVLAFVDDFVEAGL